jgi:hypothetical protein
VGEDPAGEVALELSHSCRALLACLTGLNEGAESTERELYDLLSLSLPLRKQGAALDRGHHHPARRRQGWRDLVDASGNLSWLLKKPEERQLADFVSVRPARIEAAWSGGAAEASTLHR